jgi:hypothetical protein
MPVRNRKYRPDLVSRAELSRRAGRSRAAVTIAAKAELAPAVVGRQMDAAHPAARLFVARGAMAPTSPAVATTTSSEKPEQTERTELFDVSIRRKRAEIELLELKLGERRGELISTELVRHYVFGALRTLSNALLRDLPTSLAAKLPGLPTPEERRSAIYKANSEALKRAMDAVTRALRAGETLDNDDQPPTNGTSSRDSSKPVDPDATVPST